jgi:hypothetical protein
MPDSAVFRHKKKLYKGGKRNTLHVNTAGGVEAYTMHVPHCWRWKGIHPCTFILLVVDTPCTPTLPVMERDASCTSTGLALEGGIHPAHPYCWWWEGIHPAHPYCWWWKGIHLAHPYCWWWEEMGGGWKKRYIRHWHIPTACGEKRYILHVPYILLVVHHHAHPYCLWCKEIYTAGPYTNCW